MLLSLGCVTWPLFARNSSMTERLRALTSRGAGIGCSRMLCVHCGLGSLILSGSWAVSGRLLCRTIWRRVRQPRRRLSVAFCVGFPCGCRCLAAVRVRDEPPSSQEPMVPHITLDNDEFGIRSLFIYRPETASPLCLLAEFLMRGPSTLSRGERELIATYVSSRNDCSYCTASHAASAAAQLPEGMDLVDQGRATPDTAPVTPTLTALLRIAGAVQQSGKPVRAEDVAAAREAGATDLEIHDTVLIAAAFCMYNRYVDGLATWQPQDRAMYASMGEHLATYGYLTPSLKS